MKSWLRKYTPLLLSLFMAGLLATVVLFPQVAGTPQFYLYQYLRLLTSVQYQIILIALVPLMLIFAVVFEQLARSLGWRWLNWSPFSHGFVAAPVGYKWFWFPYIITLGLCIPFMAMMEEIIFRQLWVDGWVMGILWGSLAFGVLHFVALVPIRMIIYLCVLGAIFVEVYLSHGLVAAFFLHTSYNFAALGLLVLMARFGVNNEKPLTARLRNGFARRG